ncbi:MAG: hypothetical protein WAL35_00860 [Acidimicrobiales bacterium]
MLTGGVVLGVSLSVSLGAVFAVCAVDLLVTVLIVSRVRREQSRTSRRRAHEMDDTRRHYAVPEDTRTTDAWLRAAVEQKEAPTGCRTYRWQHRREEEHRCEGHFLGVGDRT